MTSRMRVALVGSGTSAINYVRVLNESPRADIEVIIDDDLERAEILADKAGCVMATDLEAAAGCQACIITTPAHSHVPFALRLIEMGIPVLVETPLATDIDAARQVIDLATEKGVPIVCGFIERFSPSVRTARLLLDEQPIHLMTVRHSPPNPRARTSVVHDLLIHDIDLAIQFGGGPQVNKVSGSTWTPEGATFPEVADTTIGFSTGLIANLSASRISQREVRMLCLYTANRLIEVDLLRHHISVTRHVRHEFLLEGTPTYRAESIVDSPFVRPTGEPLAQMVDHFLDLAEGRIDQAAIRNSLLNPHQIAYKVQAAGA